MAQKNTNYLSLFDGWDSSSNQELAKAEVKVSNCSLLTLCNHLSILLIDSIFLIQFPNTPILIRVWCKPSRARKLRVKTPSFTPNSLTVYVLRVAACWHEISPVEG